MAPRKTTGLGRSALSRLLAFRDELATLWRAFLDPETPLWLKAAMVGVVLYLLSPFDLIPEFIPVLGLVDDVIIVPFAVNWIMRRLPPGVGAKPVNGTARRRSR
jgi:uncharacterized membrane protein YkvA (DUF1232 family)